MGKKEHRKPYLVTQGWKQRTSGLRKSRQQTHRTLGYIYRDNSSSPRRATSTVGAVHRAIVGRKVQPPGPPPHPRMSRPAIRGRRGLRLWTSTKAPSVLRRNSNNKGPETGRTGPGAGRRKAEQGKGIKPVGAEARRSGKQAQRRGAR